MFVNPSVALGQLLMLFSFASIQASATSSSTSLGQRGTSCNPPPPLDQPACAGCRSLYKFEIGSYKRDNVTWDQYANFLLYNHDVKARPLIFRHGVSKWTVTLTPPSARAIAAAVASGLPSGWTVPQYDSVTTYWVTSPAILQALTTDPAWGVLVQEAAAVEDASKGALLLGYEKVELDLLLFC